MLGCKYGGSGDLSGARGVSHGCTRGAAIELAYHLIFSNHTVHKYELWIISALSYIIMPPAVNPSSEGFFNFDTHFAVTADAYRGEFLPSSHALTSCPRLLYFYLGGIFAYPVRNID